ncbi:hypothetical protein [Magnetovibrio sp.]|uniref:hypothetical protein n=1 Tax=Magnetovibrio sp. TaxID=2024836 RepID=UPI002F927FCF
MSFQTHPTYLDFEAANADFSHRLDACLDLITADAPLHARFLNTLSMMEHMGARRIMITQSHTDLAQDTLKHMAEEARHAFFFKRQADKFAGRSMDYTSADTIAPAFARMYFKRLESFIAQDLKDVENPGLVTYLYMSMIIEFRAVWSFGVYQTRLDTNAVKLSLKSLLAEEQGHLDEMEATLAQTGIGTSERINRYLAKERELFVKLLSALEGAVLTSSSSGHAAA